MRNVIEKMDSFYNQGRPHKKIFLKQLQDCSFRTVDTCKKQPQEQNFEPEDLFRDFWLMVHRESEERQPQEQDFEQEDLFRDFWSMVHKESEERQPQEQDFEQEDLFHDFWLMVHKESEERVRSKLSKEVLNLRKRELWRKYISLVPIVPFAALMFIQLTTLCSNAVLLTLIGYALKHTVVPLEAFSLVCVVYLIYNNRKMRKKEQALKDLENERWENRKVEKNGEKPDNTQEYLNYIEAITTTIVIVSDIVSMVLAQEHEITEQQRIAIDEVEFLLSNLVSVSVNCTSFCIANKKRNRADVCDKDKNAAGLMLTGSCMLLMRRITLMILALSLNAHTATTVGAVVGSAMGLIGIGCSLAGHTLAISSCKSKLQNLEISGRGIERGTTSNTISTSRPFTTKSACQEVGI